MDEAAISDYITSAFEGVTLTVAEGDYFFIFDPEQKFPFATIVTRDNDYDHISELNRPGIFRLNLEVTKATYRDLFGEDKGGEESGRDFTVLDTLMPHPMYGRMHWLCILNPSEAKFEEIKPLLAEGYALSVRKHGHKQRDGETGGEEG